MSRLISLCLLAAILTTGCGGDDKEKDKNASSPTVPPVGNKFDKSKEVKGKPGSKFD